MVQVFRDRWRDQPGPRARAAWVVQTALDFARTLPVACWEERNVWLFPSWRARPSAAGCFYGTTATVLVYVAIVTFTALMPRTYLSTARVKVLETPAVALLGSATGAKGGAVPDPLVMQADTERVLSDAVLKPVIERLDLTRRMADMLGSSTPLSPDITPLVLRWHLEARPFRDTTMLEIRAYFRDAQLGAEVANAVAESFRDLHPVAVAGGTSPVAIADAAEPGLRPIHPNVPLNLVTGLLVAGAAGAVVFALVWAVGNVRRRAANPPPVPSM